MLEESTPLFPQGGQDAQLGPPAGGRRAPTPKILLTTHGDCRSCGIKDPVRIESEELKPSLGTSAKAQLFTPGLGGALIPTNMVRSLGK